MMQSIFIAMPMMVCAIFTVELWLSWLHQRDSARGWLALWALVTTLLYSGHFVFFHHAYHLLPLSDTVYVACNLLVYPMYLIYISELTDARPLSGRLPLMILLLGFPVLVSLVVWSLYANMTTEDVGKFINLYLYKGSHSGLTGVAEVQAWVHDAAHVLFGLQVIVVMTAGIGKIRRYNRRLKYHFADTEDKHLSGITLLLWLLVATSLFSSIVNVIGRYWFEGSLLLALPSLLFSVLLFCIGWNGLTTRSYLFEMIHSETATPKVSNASGPDYKALAQQFDQVMTVEKLFLLHDLRLDTVVQRLATNRTYLLAALKQELKMSFSEYVNEKRIEYAHQLLESNPNLTKGDVSTLSGYNSPSAFYRNWKSYHVKTIGKNEAESS